MIFPRFKRLKEIRSGDLLYLTSYFRRKHNISRGFPSTCTENCNTKWASSLFLKCNSTKQVSSSTPPAYRVPAAHPHCAENRIGKHTVLTHSWKTHNSPKENDLLPAEFNHARLSKTHSRLRKPAHTHTLAHTHSHTKRLPPPGSSPLIQRVLNCSSPSPTIPAAVKEKPWTCFNIYTTHMDYINMLLQETVALQMVTS